MTQRKPSKIAHVIGNSEEELNYLPRLSQVSDFEEQLLRTEPVKKKPKAEKPEENKILGVDPVYTQAEDLRNREIQRNFDKLQSKEADIEEKSKWRQIYQEIYDRWTGNGIAKDARRSFSEMEKAALIEEPTELDDIRNRERLDLEGTHYVTDSPGDIYRQMPKGL